MTTSAQDRAYQFAPLDRSGVLLGLSGAQCGVLAAGLFTAATILQNGHPAMAAVTAVAIATALALGRWRGHHLLEWLPVLGRFAILAGGGKRRWLADISQLSSKVAGTETGFEFPPFLGALAVVDAAPPRWAGCSDRSRAAVVWERQGRSVSGSLRVCSREFSLLDRPEQERIAQLWADALGAFCVERGPVVRVAASEWMAPVGVGRHDLGVVDEDRGDERAVSSYLGLLAEAAPRTVRREVIVTVTVDLRRVRSARKQRRVEEVGAEVVMDELGLLASRLDAAGLATDSPVTPSELAEALRLRLDPTCASRLTTRAASLAQLAGIVSSHLAGPLATESAWDHVRVDGSLHRCYWVAEWPRLEVGPSWLEPLLLYPGGTRTFTMLYEPVAPSRSQRQVDRDSTRFAADDEQRERSGFRIGARHRRVQAAVLEREAELVAGYAEFEFAGLLTVTAPDEESLQRASAEYEQAAAQAGLEIRPLHGRHDLALACSLPLGRGLAPRRFV